MNADHTRAWAAAAGSLAVLGVVATVWRPLAPALPPGTAELATFDGPLLEAIARYRTPRIALAPAATVLWILVPVALAASPRARAAVRRWTHDHQRARWRAGAAAAAVTALAWLATLPITAWLGLVHEARWGFRTASAATWWRDQLLVAGGRCLVVGIGVAVLLAARDRWPGSWHHRLTVLATVVASGLVVVHPVVLQPLLLPTAPLPPGPTSDAVSEVLASAGAADATVLVGDASRRTTRVNAVVTGLGPTERVVLFDNLLELPPPTVAAVVAHELAHRDHADVLRGTLLTATAAWVGLGVLRRVLAAPATVRRYELRTPGDPRAVLVVVAVAAVLELAGSPVAAAVSRRVEAAADHRALELGADPAEQVRSVRAFVVRDLAAPDPAPLIQLWYGSHPTPEQRLRATVAAAERDGAPLPSPAEIRDEERAIRHPLVPPAPDDEDAA